MSKISINRLLEKGELRRKKLEEAEKLKSLKQAETDTSLDEKVNSWKDNPNGKAVNSIQSIDAQVFVPYLVNNSKFDDVYLHPVTQEELSRFIPGKNIEGTKIQYKGHDWTWKFLTRELVVGDVIGIPQYLDGRNFNAQTVLREMVRFGSVFDKGAIIEVSASSIEKNRNENERNRYNAIAKWVNIGGYTFNVHPAVLTDCRYLVDNGSGVYKFKITGVSRERAPSAKLYAELVEGKRDARQKSIDSLKKSDRKMQNDIDDIYHNARAELGFRSDDGGRSRLSSSYEEIDPRRKGNIKIYLDDFTICGGNPFRSGYGQIITFDDVKSKFGDSLTNVLVLYQDGSYNFSQGVRMTNNGSVIPIAINKLDQIIPNLVKNYGADNIAILTNAGASSTESYIRKLRYKPSTTLL